MQALYPQSYTFRWTVQNTTKVPNASLFKIVFMVEVGAIGRLHQTSYLIVQLGTRTVSLIRSAWAASL